MYDVEWSQKPIFTNKQYSTKLSIVLQLSVNFPAGIGDFWPEKGDFSAFCRDAVEKDADGGEVWVVLGADFV